MIKITLEELRSKGSSSLTDQHHDIGEHEPAFDIETFKDVNVRGNKLIQFPHYCFYILNNKNCIIARGPHLAPLWNMAHHYGKSVQHITKGEKEAILLHRAPKKSGATFKRKWVRKVNPVHSNGQLDTRRFLELLGARGPIEERKKEPAMIVAYIDPQFIQDRLHVNGIAMKVS